MRIVQTFWTAGHNPLEYGFGWRHPEYNLMSWSLSCLCLRRLFRDVALYTDKEGKHILIDLLHLPYTEVHVVYDQTLGLPQHWAQAKLKTYAMQSKPFLHVDGDVYLTRPLPEDVVRAAIVVQNREIGTGYYRTMIDEILKYPDIKLPQYIADGLQENALASYNMGVFGGADLKFIGHFCDEAFRFLEYNRMNDVSNPYSFVDCNILYEQMFLAALADKNQIKVASLHVRPVMDEGYSEEEYCDLMNFDKKPFFHILGGHKQNKDVCERLGKVLLSLFPQHYLSVFRLFPRFNMRLVLHGRPFPSPLSVEKCIAKYEDFVLEAEQHWRTLSFESIFQAERRIYKNMKSIQCAESNLVLNPYIKIFEIPDEWPVQAKRILCDRMGQPMSKSKRWIILVPELTGIGIKEICIRSLGMNLIACLSNGFCHIQEIIDEQRKYMKPMSEVDLENSINKEIKYLMYFGLISMQEERYNVIEK